MKSAEVRLNEALEHLKKTSPTQYKLVSETLPSMIGAGIEAQASFAEKVANIKEAQRTIKKYNGDEHNGLITESFSGRYMTETHNRFAKGDRLIAESLGLTDEQIRQLEGRAPREIEELGEAAVREYQFCIGIRLTEAQAVASVTKQFGK